MKPRSFVPFDVFGMREDVRVSTMVRVGDLGWTCGQCPLDKDGAVVSPGDLLAQGAFVASMIETVLQRGGFERGQVAKLAVYLQSTSIGDEAKLFALLRARFPDAPVLVPIRVPHFYYEGMLLEVDVFTDAGLEPFHRDMGEGRQRRQSQEYGYARLSTPYKAGQSLNQVVRELENQRSVLNISAESVLSETMIVEGSLDKPSLGTVSRLTGSVIQSPKQVNPLIHMDILYSRKGVVQRFETSSNGLTINATSDGNLTHLSVLCEDESLSIVGQTKAMMAGLDATLKAAELSFDHVVKVSANYVGGASEEELHGNLQVRHSFHALPGPASTGLPVAGLAHPSAKIAISLFAMA